MTSLGAQTVISPISDQPVASIEWLMISGVVLIFFSFYVSHFYIL